MYQVLTPSRSSTLALRHLNYHVRHWGPEQSDLPTLVLLHGWMDVSASYQFTVDALRQPRRIIAPDWRGFGLTTGAPVDHYVFADYLADLDLLLDHYAPGEAIDLVGHSMGGNVAMMYGGVRPERVRKLVNLEGFGLPATRPAQAPTRYAQWIDEIKQRRRQGAGAAVVLGVAVALEALVGHARHDFVAVKDLARALQQMVE